MRKIIILFIFFTFFVQVFSFDVNSKKLFIKDFLKEYCDEDPEKISIKIYVDKAEYNRWRDQKIINSYANNGNFDYIFKFYDNGSFRSVKSKKSQLFFDKTEEKKKILSDDILLKKANKIVEKVFNVKLGEKFKLFSIKKFKDSYQRDFNRISIEYTRLIQGYPSSENIYICMYLDGTLEILSNYRDFFKKVKKFNQKINRAEAIEIAENIIKKKHPELYDTEKYSFVGAMDTGEIASVWFSLSNFKEPYVCFTDISYMRSYNTTWLSKFLNRKFPRSPSLNWFIDIRYKNKRVFETVTNPDELSDTTKYDHVTVVIDAETGKVKHVLPSITDIRFKD